MNSFAPVTGAEYVYVELADGSQGKMRKSDLAKVISCLRRSNLYGNSSNGVLYSKVAVINAPNGEGLDYSLSLLISGGNIYTEPVAITFLSINVHRKGVRSAKANIIGLLEVGYVYTNEVLSVWIKRDQFSHYTNVSVLSEKGNDALTGNDVSSSAPDGYIIIGK